MSPLSVTALSYAGLQSPSTRAMLKSARDLGALEQMQSPGGNKDHSPKELKYLRKRGPKCTFLSSHTCAGAVRRIQRV